jgi:undecaprenyl-phosphate galactose phosphotransferase
MKRALDLLLSLSLILALLPFFIVMVAFIRREDSGPAFFVQGRIGRGGQVFNCYKFRTMRSDAEQMLKDWQKTEDPLYQEYVESNYKLRNDPRVTRVGLWLRTLSLDELPQLLNVVKGDMSLVGPRPLLPSEVSAYGANIARYQEARPGITGLWQVSGRSDTTFQKRIELDVTYIENQTLFRDLWILWRTALVLTSKEGAY